MDKVNNIISEIETLKQEKKFLDAIKLLERYISKYSDDYRLYEELADIYLYNWNLAKATKSINFALTLKENSATWNYLKWFILLSQDKVKESVSFLVKSNNLMWNNAEVLRNLGWAYTMLWENERWIYILKRALNISPWDNLITEDLAMALIWAWEVQKWNILLKKIWKEKKTS